MCSGTGRKRSRWVTMAREPIRPVSRPTGVICTRLVHRAEQSDEHVDLIPLVGERVDEFGDVVVAAGLRSSSTSAELIATSRRSGRARCRRC
ncbi:hypothetical protein C8039_13225 [Halogeometricum sp. wsp3]|nr:hypothetical protein C8039_13225 [Halogeometricum sp. wsp3]